ncbi:MAG: hypothetical protein KatS3mg013_0559 [Actinomycetota bacterium]|jgi:cell division protein FtsQ|nr:MAG: hypothetical protein KatS3mg013_0559 [Actinomycetota bacterium]
MGPEWLRTRGGRRALVLAAAVALTGAAVGSTYTPLFGAREIRVVGARRVSEDRIRQLGGLTLGTNVFHLDLDRTASAITADPWIAEARLERHLPGRIVVRVRERVPVAWALVDGARRLVGEDGALLPGRIGPSVPELRSVGGVLDPAERAAVAGALAAMSGRTRRAVDTAFVEPDGELVFTMADGATVRYGLPTEVEAKGRALEAIRRWAAQRGTALQAIDVAVPSAPTVRPAD